jgi:hypothetical protein
MHESLLPLPRRAPQAHHQRVRALGQPLDRVLYLADVAELGKPLGPGVDLAECLRPAQQQDAQHGALARGDAVDLLDAVLVAERAGRVHHPDQALVL